MKGGLLKKISLDQIFDTQYAEFLLIRRPIPFRKMIFLNSNLHFFRLIMQEMIQVGSRLLYAIE